MLSYSLPYMADYTLPLLPELWCYTTRFGPRTTAMALRLTCRTLYREIPFTGKLTAGEALAVGWNLMVCTMARPERAAGVGEALTRLIDDRHPHVPALLQEKPFFFKLVYIDVMMRGWILAACRAQYTEVVQCLVTHVCWSNVDVLDALMDSPYKGTLMQVLESIKQREAVLNPDMYFVLQEHLRKDASLLQWLYVWNRMKDPNHGDTVQRILASEDFEESKRAKKRARHE